MLQGNATAAHHIRLLHALLRASLAQLFRQARTLMTMLKEKNMQRGLGISSTSWVDVGAGFKPAPTILTAINNLRLLYLCHARMFLSGIHVFIFFNYWIPAKSLRE